MYILSMSKKAFLRLEENGDVTVVSNPERATKIKTMGDAMREATRINKDFRTTLVKVLAI